MYLAALKAFFSCSLVCVVVECSSDIKICSNRLEPVDGLPISACGNLAYLQHYKIINHYHYDMTSTSNLDRAAARNLRPTKNSQVVP